MQCFRLTTFFYSAFCISFLFTATYCATNQDLSCDFRNIAQDLSAPTNFNAIAADAQVQLSWDTKPSLDYYAYWSTNSGVDINDETEIANVTSPFKHTKLTNGRTYYYIIVANNGFSVSLPSSEQSATPMQTPPPIQAPLPMQTPSPTGLKAVAGVEAVKISWTAVMETTYTLYWSTTRGAGDSGAKVAHVTSPYTHMGADVINGTDYYYVLTAKKANSFVSPPSSEQSATPVQTVAIWTLGAKQGNFRYRACENERANGGINSIGAKLRSLGYTKAVFFGSTNQYHFNTFSGTIVSNAAGLELGSTGSHQLRLFKLTSGTPSVPEEVTGNSTKTIQDIIANFSAGNRSLEGILSTIGVMRPSSTSNNCGAWWTFTNSTGTLSSHHCNNAQSNKSTEQGTLLETLYAGNFDRCSCDNYGHVVCVAK